MIFDSIMKQYSLHEDNTGDDNQPNTDNQDTNTTTDTTAGDNDEYTVNDPDTEGTDDADNTENQDNDQTDDQDNTDDDEYTINDPDEEDTTDDNQDNAGDQDTTEDDDDEYSINDPDEEDNTDDQDESTDDSDPSAKLKSLEKSIFDQLSPELQQSKTAELKKLYNDTYDKCQSIIDIISTADKQPDQVKIYDYILNSLIDLQKYIKDYLTNIFDSKTYIENMTELQKYLAILDTVNGVFEDMSKTSTGDDNK